MKNLVLVHGWATDSRIWGRQQEAFASQANIWAPDLPVWEAAWLREHLRLLDPASTILVGWSLGGMLALEVCAEGFTPWALVTIAAAASFCRKPDFSLGVGPAVVRGMRQRLRANPTPVVKEFYRQLLATGEGQWWDTLESLLPETQDPVWLARGLDYLAFKDLRSTLPGVAAQNIVVVHGERDRINNAAQAFFLREQLPAGNLVALPGAGHVPMLTRSQELNEIIAEFL